MPEAITPIPEQPESDAIDTALDAVQDAIAARPVVVGVVLDRSGSMQNIKDATINGFNEFLQEQQKLPGRALFSLTLFDTSFEDRYDLVPIDQVEELDKGTYAPNGGTALFDAIGRTISNIEKGVANLGETPSRTILVILTDGEENQSQEFKGQVGQQKIKKLIEDKQSQSDPWDIVFLGANQDAFTTSASLGVARGSTATYGASAAGAQTAFRSASLYAGRSRKYAGSPGGQSITNSFTSEESAVLASTVDPSATPTP